MRLGERVAYEVTKTNLQDFLVAGGFLQGHQTIQHNQLDVVVRLFDDEFNVTGSRRLDW